MLLCHHDVVGMSTAKSITFGKIREKSKMSNLFPTEHEEKKERAREREKRNRKEKEKKKKRMYSCLLTMKALDDQAPPPAPLVP